MTMTRRFVSAFGVVVAMSVIAVHASVPDNVLVQQMVDQLATTTTGGLVTLDARQYYFDAPVTVPSKVTVCGQGQSTRIRAIGDHFLFKAKGNYVRFCNMLLDAASPQVDGGGISFELAERNVTVDDLTFEHNLGTSLDVAPVTDNMGIYFFRRLRWNGVLGHRMAMRLGDGIHHLTDISITGMSGTAATPADMPVWIYVNPDVDTVHIRDLTLIVGGTGVLVGAGASGPSAVTGFSLMDAPAIESMSGYGVLVQSANNVRLSNLSLAQNQGGVGIGAGARGLVLSNSVIHANRGDGVTMWAGASGATITNNVIGANNLSNAPWGFGISIGGGVSDFTVSNNRIGNNVVWGGSGHQRYCIYLAAGPSNRYSITGNSCLGHTYGDAIVDGGTGTKKVITGNY